MTLVQTEPKSIKIGSTAIKRVTIRPNGTEKQIRPAGWQPGANTIAYYPLNSTSTVNDLSGNNNNGTINGTVTFGTNLGVDCGAFLSIGYITIPHSSSMVTSSITISFYCAIKNGYESNNGGLVAKTSLSSSHGAYHVANLVGTGSDVGTNCIFSINRDAGKIQKALFSGNNIRTYIAATYDGTTLSLYKNGVLLGTSNYSYNISTDTNKLVLGAYYSSTYKMNGYLSNVILENKIRTAQEVSDYYNQTKGDYGL